MTMRSRIPLSDRAGQGGMMLLEALIAILIFSIGILGVIGLQAMASQQSADARYRAVAAQLADQLLGQMWLGDRTEANLRTQYATCNTSTCPGYTAWATQVAQKLPGVNATGTNQPVVTVSNNGSGTVAIVVFWQLPADVAAGAPAHQFRMEAQIGQ
jgi:type IV pilus assembly protein PilV